MKKRKTFGGRLLFGFLNQIIPVMIGVYLGFALNNYGVAQQAKKDRVILRQMIEQEMKHNLSEIEERMPYHMQLIDTLSYFLEQEISLEDFGSNFTFTGLRTYRAVDGANKTFIQTGAVKSEDIEFVMKMNEVYGFQEDFNALMNIVLQSQIALKLPVSDQELRSVLSSTIINLNDMAGSEGDMLGYYCQFLNEFYQDEEGKICEIR